MTEQSIFTEALEIADPAARGAFLDRACAGDAALRERVDRLLGRLGGAGSFLERPAAVSPSAEESAAAGPPLTPTSEHLPGTGSGVIGPYTLLEVIGEGGMGAVYLARQHEPVKRLVAVKVIKAGMDTAQVVARFEAERQALALMDHPNIAKVLDAGATPEGRPFFVMEHVKGVPITRFCDDRRLTPRERLELFVPVCQAVQHAHQKGVVHRDLKPSNVLVTVYDGRPVPKVIDFGIAKATGQPLTERTLVTGLGAVIGTPEYMSPEQAGLHGQDVDTRADVYALGVLVYELLTGTTPVDRRRLKEAVLLELLRVIREEEPPKPSTRLSASDTLPGAAAARQTEPARLVRLVRGDLDWIVMKALDKDRDRRYETANAFAADVQRYLADEPVLAGPPSGLYRLKKFVRRNRGPVAAGTALLLALVVGIVGTTWGLVSARRANDRAQRRLVPIEKGNEVLASVFTDLDVRKVKEDAEPLEAVLARRLMKAGAELDEEAVGDPLVVAGLQNRLGLALMHLGYPREALPLLSRARQVYETRLGTDHGDTLDVTNNLGSAYRDDGQLDLASRLLDETLGLRRVKLGPDDPATLTTMNNLAGVYWAMGKSDRALPMWEECLRLRRAKLGVDHPSTLGSLNNLALVYQSTGKLDVAVPLFEEALRLERAKLGNDHADTLAGMSNLAVAYVDAGKSDVGVPLLEDNLRLRRAKLGAGHPHTLECMNNLGTSYTNAGRVDLAVPLLEDAVRLGTARYGADHPITLKALNSLAQAYQAVGKPDRAVSLLEEALRSEKATVGADHPETLRTMHNLAAAYEAAGKLNLAAPLYEETLKLKRTKLGDDHPQTLSTLNGLAVAYQAAGKLDLALPLLTESLRAHKAKLGADHPGTLVSMSNLAGYYLAVGKLDYALPLLEEAAAGVDKRHFRVANGDVFVGNLTYCYEQLKRFDQAELWRRKWLAVVKEQSGADGAAYAAALGLLAMDLLAQRKWTDAEMVLRECLSIREKIAPDVWTTFNTRSQLGGALLGQKKYADAEPLLIDGYEGMRKRTGTIPPRGKDRLTEALERLVSLYTELGKNDKADEWRARLEAQKKQ